MHCGKELAVTRCMHENGISFDQCLQTKQRQTPLSWYLATFQISFAAFFNELASITISEMRGLGLELSGLSLGFYSKVKSLGLEV